MRIDPKGTIAGHPAMLVRDVLRRLRVNLDWNLDHVQAAAKISADDSRAFVTALVTAGLIESAGTGRWAITQAGQTLSSATAARPVTRATAERALREFLGRVDFVNRNRRYLGKVISVVLFGSMLKHDVERVSDVDIAVKIVPKEADPERARDANDRRAQDLQQFGRRFQTLLDWQTCWYRESFTYLKGRSRTISLADLKREGEFIMAVPHRVLYEHGTWKPDAPSRIPVVVRRPRSSEDNELF